MFHASYITEKPPNSIPLHFGCSAINIVKIPMQIIRFTSNPASIACTLSQLAFRLDPPVIISIGYSRQIDVANKTADMQGIRTRRRIRCNTSHVTIVKRLLHCKAIIYRWAGPIAHPAQDSPHHCFERSFGGDVTIVPEHRKSFILISRQPIAHNTANSQNHFLCFTTGLNRTQVQRIDYARPSAITQNTANKKSNQCFVALIHCRNFTAVIQILQIHMRREFHDILIISMPPNNATNIRHRIKRHKSCTHC